MSKRWCPTCGRPAITPKQRKLAALRARNYRERQKAFREPVERMDPAIVSAIMNPNRKSLKAKP